MTRAASILLDVIFMPKKRGGGPGGGTVIMSPSVT
tara:strand:- start:970 stop:1074 length:105 start_codon:yes stop_codon:yes gene_type:complete